MTRQEANFKILNQLKDYFTLYPDLRFGQGLYNLGIATHLKGQDIFFQESELTSKLLSQWVPDVEKDEYGREKFPVPTHTITGTAVQLAAYKDGWFMSRENPPEEIYSMDGLNWFKLEIIDEEDKKVSEDV